MTLTIAPELNLDFVPESFENNETQVQDSLKQKPSSSIEELHKEESSNFSDYELMNLRVVSFRTFLLRLLISLLLQLRYLKLMIAFKRK